MALLLLVEYKRVQLLRKTVFLLLIKINIHLTYDPEISHLDIYPRVMNMYVHTNICT